MANNFDVDSFVATVGDPNSVEPPVGYEGDAECWGERYGWADVNGDTYINNFDVDPFVDLLVGGQAALARQFTWNAENRLVMAAPVQSPPPLGAQRVKFVYDYMGRRVEKLVETWTDDTPDDLWVPTSRTRYVYDGWLLLEELEVDTEGDVVGVLRQYTWGLDLAGLTGSINHRTSAGGIGGLLAMYDTMGTTTGENPTADDESYYYCYDANGNVGQVLDLAGTGGGGATLVIAAQYEYDPYGSRINTPGGGELDQPFRFSTKYFDVHTAMYYYGYRYLLAMLGRWGSRDPIGEGGGSNLYTYVSGDPLIRLDPLGLCDSPCTVKLAQTADRGLGGDLVFGDGQHVFLYFASPCDGCRRGEAHWGSEFGGGKGRLAPMGGTDCDGDGAYETTYGFNWTNTSFIQIWTEQRQTIQDGCDLCACLRDMMDAVCDQNYAYVQYNCRTGAIWALEQCGVQVPLHIRNKWKGSKECTELTVAEGGGNPRDHGCKPLPGLKRSMAPPPPLPPFAPPIPELSPPSFPRIP